MRNGALQKITFISKSLLWSLLLYFVSMAIINWDETVKGFHKNNGGGVAIINMVPMPGAQPAAGTSTGSNIPQINKDVQATAGIIRTAKEILQYVNNIAGIAAR